MRIVGGSLRSRVINAPIGDNTRPTSDKTREAIFNIISRYVYDANVLDIFAGSGALGIEAISRGANHATFIDKDAQAIKVINENINSLKIKDKTNVIFDSFESISKLNTKFDLIMLDPPYKLDVFPTVLELIKNNNLISDNGVIVFESNEEHKIVGNIEGYTYKVYKYGIAFVNILYKL